LIVSVLLSLLSTFYYLRLIKMALFDGFENAVNSKVIFDVRSVSDATLTSAILIIPGLVTAV